MWLSLYYFKTSLFEIEGSNLVISLKVVFLFSSQFEQRFFAGGHRGVVTPVPIPNTEVKCSIAEGSAGLARARVGRRRLFLFKPIIQGMQQERESERDYQANGTTETHGTTGTDGTTETTETDETHRRHQDCRDNQDRRDQRDLTELHRLSYSLSLFQSPLFPISSNSNQQLSYLPYALKLWLPQF